jgi:hypothetical protein
MPGNAGSPSWWYTERLAVPLANQRIVGRTWAHALSQPKGHPPSISLSSRAPKARQHPSAEPRLRSEQTAPRGEGRGGAAEGGARVSRRRIRGSWGLRAGVGTAQRPAQASTVAVPPAGRRRCGKCSRADRGAAALVARMGQRAQHLLLALQLNGVGTTGVARVRQRVARPGHRDAIPPPDSPGGWRHWPDARPGWPCPGSGCPPRRLQPQVDGLRAIGARP